MERWLGTRWQRRLDSTSSRRLCQRPLARPLSREYFPDPVTEPKISGSSSRTVVMKTPLSNIRSHQFCAGESEVKLNRTQADSLSSKSRRLPGREVIPPSEAASRSLAFRLRCGKHLRGIAR